MVSNKQKKLRGYFRDDRAKPEPVTIPVKNLTPLKTWSKNVQTNFNHIVTPLEILDVISEQDIPSLYHLGELLQELENLEKSLAKDADAEDREKFLNSKIKLIKTYNELARNFFVSPMARTKAVAMLVQKDESKKLLAETIIQQGEL